MTIFEELVKEAVAEARAKNQSSPVPDYTFQALNDEMIDLMLNWESRFPSDKKFMASLIRIATICQMAAEDWGLLACHREF